MPTMCQLLCWPLERERALSWLPYCLPYIVDLVVEVGTGTGLAPRAHAQGIALVTGGQLEPHRPTQSGSIPSATRKTCPFVVGSFPEGRTVWCTKARDTLDVMLHQRDYSQRRGGQGEGGWRRQETVAGSQMWGRAWSLIPGS